MENNLPQGWVWFDMLDVINYEGGSQPPKKVFTYEPKKGYIRLVQIRDYGDKPFPTYVPDSTKLKKAEKNDLLIARYGGSSANDSLGRICSGIEGAYNVALAKVIFPKQFLNTSFVRYLLSGPWFKERLNSLSRSCQTGFNREDLQKLYFPLPPLEEQHRIVEKLDAVMQKVESNKQRIDKIPKLLKRFRQSVLAAAVSGRLTEEWRIKQGILVDWEFKSAEETCQLITKGTTPINNGLTANGEIPYLKVYNIVEQIVDFNYKPQFVSREIHTNFLKRSRVYPGDVLMNIVGPPLGKVAIVPNYYEEWNINQAIAFFRAKEMILPKFIYIILCEGSPIIEIEKEYRGTAGQSNISLEQCRNFSFPVPEIKEQKEIVRRVEQLFDFADKLEDRYSKAKAMLDKLPQSILAKAFRGELVSQDSNDEPASVLLEQIKGEKLKATKNIRKKK